jgi:hypothetical protein
MALSKSYYSGINRITFFKSEGRILDAYFSDFFNFNNISFNKRRDLAAANIYWNCLITDINNG